MWFVPVFAVLLFVVNVLQSATTGLLHDEAYYWYTSVNMEWGHFFGPPLISLLTGAGYALLQNDVGVRLVGCLVTSLTVLALHNLIQPKNKLLFIAIVCSVSPFMIAGYVAALDQPLMFFALLFLLSYRWFLKDESWGSVIAMGVSMALMLYIKYHGVLAIIFLLLSNLALLKNYKWYVASAVGALLYVPHIVWLFQNDFAPVMFHLVDRSPEGFSVKEVLDFLGAQTLMAGVPAGLILLYAAFKSDIKNKTDTALKWVMLGIYGFFFVNAFRGHTEANWTAICLVPLCALSYSYLEQQATARKWLYRLLPLSLTGILFARIFLATDFFADKLHLKTEVHHWRDWAEIVKQKAQGRPVVFMNSYQKASKYIYYTGGEAISLNNVMSNKNQFSINRTELELEGRPVYFYSHYGITPTFTTATEVVQTPVDNFTGCMADSFMSWMKVKVVPEYKQYAVKSSDTKFKVNYTVSIPEAYKHRDTKRAFMSWQIINDKRLPYDDSITGLTLHDALLKNNNVMQIPVPEEKGRYTFFISTSNDGYPPHINSPRMELVVE